MLTEKSEDRSGLGTGCFKLVSLERKLLLLLAAYLPVFALFVRGMMALRI